MFTVSLSRNRGTGARRNFPNGQGNERSVVAICFADNFAFSETHGGAQVEAARDRLVPQITKVVERAQQDGYLRPDVSQTDMPIFGLMTGTVSEFAAHVDPQLWKRYVAILLDGIRQRSDQTPLTTKALEEEELEAAMQGWQPAGPC
jgi:hypothetical protein